MPALDDYLERLRRELQAPPEEAEKVLQELRTHLELALRDARRGSSDPASCMEQVVECFGAAEQIGRDLRQVHGRATWQEAGAAVCPIFLFSFLAALPHSPTWIGLLALAGVTAVGWRVGWPLWWWAWLGWLPFAIPGVPEGLLWGTVAYAIILMLVSRRDWLEATLAIYPLPTAWAFYRAILTSGEIRNVGWSAATLGLLGLSAAMVWAALLTWTLRSPPGQRRIARVLQGQGLILLLHGLAVIAARLWPTHPVPYPFTWQHLIHYTLPYAVIYGLPFLLLFVLSSLPAILALIQVRSRRPPGGQGDRAGPGNAGAK
ncbi:MAG: hypothetical protein JW900_12695 [Anaerolineae bacterium]|nr:hypothetical protein [Anaerolineae bacterium]